MLFHTDINSSIRNSCVRLSCAGDHVLYSSCHDGPKYPLAFSHPHWDGFLDLSYQSHVVFGVATIFIAITAILGNFAVIWTFCRYRSLRSTANILIINLSAADLLMAIIMVMLHTSSALAGRWLYGRTGCMIYAATCALAAFVSISSMTVIALERHLVITHKFALTGILSKGKAIRWCIGTWVFSLILSCCPFLGWGRYVPEGVQSSCTFDFFSRDWNNLSFVLTISMVGFIIPFLIICVCYIGILVAITNHEHEIRRTAIVRSSKESRRTSHFKSTKTDVKTAKIIFSTVTLFCLSWLPYCIIAFIGSFGNACVITPLVSAIPGMVAKAATVFNPLVYALCHQRYKTKMQLIFRCFKRRPFPGTRVVLGVNHKYSSNYITDESKDIHRCVKSKLSFKSREGHGSPQSSPGSHDISPPGISRFRWLREHNFSAHQRKSV